MNARGYAQALSEYSHQHPETDAKLLYERLRDILSRHGHLSLLPGIKRELERLSERAEESGAKLFVAREADTDEAQKNVAQHLEALGISQEELATITDETLIGGYVVETNDRILDASYKRMLRDLYQKMTA